MAVPLRVLCVEDQPADAELMIHELRRAGMTPQWQRVETEADYLAALESAPDVILCDHNLPQFNSMRAFALLKKRDMDVPFIIVSGMIEENAAIQALKQGVSDYLLKDRLGRLGQAVEHALAERDVRNERRKLEEQLRQSQKLEAIGQLAGGVAHDFNNLLTVILGYTEMLLMQTPAGNPAALLLQEIKKAGGRAAELTHQLLAFSRKQILQPRVIVLNQLVGETEKMLRRLIGENVQLTTRFAEDLWPVLADPGQIHQVLMNLAINARDAMPQGGDLIVETANLQLTNDGSTRFPDIRPGPYVVLTVSDTGCGMDKATLGRIFEPFFTTKDVDKGTGLGLSVVFGIVAQSGGHIHVHSEVGQGTTFTIHLPRHENGRTAPANTSTVLTMPRGTETILLAEDETEVRRLAAHVLTQCGYRVLESCDGIDAMQKAAAYTAEIHLLVTDVVMPRMSGRQLADLLRVLRPGIRILYVSGYTANIIAEQGILEAGIAMLPKPFVPTGLALKVREVLDGIK